MTKPLRLGREALLWVGGVLGALCLLSLLAGWLFNVTPLVFASGSMSPAYEAGALGVAHEVPAAELEVGDVVSVVNGQGDRVTHRIVGLDRVGNGAVLTLQGDTNNVPDAEAYTVAAADRVTFGVPYAGYVLNAAASPFGLLVVALLVGSSLWIGFGRRNDDDSPPARTRVLVSTGVAGVVVAGTLLGASGQAPWAFTSAFWTDSAVATTTASIPAVVDTTPPVLSDPLPASGATAVGWTAAIYCSSSAQQICVNATDTGGTGVNTVFVKLIRTSGTMHCWDGTAFVDGTTCASQPMTLVSGNQYRTNGLTAAAMVPGAYQATFTASDVAGNVATPLVSTFTVTAGPHAQPSCTDTGPNGRARISFIDTSDTYQYAVQVRRADDNSVTHNAILGSTTSAGQTVTYDVPDTNGGAGQNGNYVVTVQTQLIAGSVNVGSTTTTPIHRNPLSGGNNWRAFCGVK